MSLHLDAAWLREQYVVNGLSTYDIAKIVGRDPKHIYDKLRDFGIPTRPRGQNLRGADNYVAAGGAPVWLGRRHTADARAKISAKAARPKPGLRGAANGMSGRTGTSNPNFRGGTSPERQRIYAGAEWQETMRATYARDGYRCRRCESPKCGRRSLHAHHVASWAEFPALRFDLANIVTLCRACHEWVHSRANVGGEFLHHSRPALRNSDST